jgi:hypothetical protein
MVMRVILMGSPELVVSLLVSLEVSAVVSLEVLLEVLLELLELLEQATRAKTIVSASASARIFFFMF